MKTFMVLTGIVMLIAGTASATLSTWDYSWEADDLPHNDPNLVWGRSATAFFEEINNFDGTVNIRANDFGELSYWLLNDSGAGLGKANWSEGGSIEWKLTPHTSGNISFMHIGDGTYEYTVGMYPGYWSYIDTSGVRQWEGGAGHTVGTDIYRLDLDGGTTAALYLNDAFVLDIPGYVGDNPGDPPNNFGVHEQIYWGTNPGTLEGGDAEWDYIRWDVSDPNFGLVVAPSLRNVGNLAGSTTFDVSNNGILTGMTWDAAESETWFSLTGGSGTDAGTFTVNYDENTGAERTGNITVTAAGANGSPSVVMVTQAGAPVCGDFGFPPHDTTGPGGVPDCIVDIYDFRDFAFYWLTCTPPVVCP
jgi:hypothetical protein